MKVAKTITTGKPLPFEELQKYYKACVNRIYGVTRPLKEQYPKGNHNNNKFKTK